MLSAPEQSLLLNGQPRQNAVAYQANTMASLAPKLTKDIRTQASAYFLLAISVTVHCLLEIEGMKALAICLVALFLSETAVADDSTRQTKIAQIIEAQGLHQMFQQQLDQSNASAGEFGRNIFKKMLSESGVPEDQQNPQVEQVFARYMERCTTMFSAKELVDTWTAFYGKDLSESELDQILAYYRSPVGQKDVLSSQTAMIGFAQTMNAESEERLNASVAQLMSELRTAMTR